ncbi:MAG: protein kinase [Clostridia bacterium]
MKASTFTKTSLAFDEVLNCKVVIKELWGDFEKAAGDYDVLKDLKHYGLPRILDAFTQNDRSYLVIEHIQGPTLREKVEKEGALDEKTALGRARDILLTLDYLHKISPRPVIHGDIKPDNILFCTDRTVLIDFGSVRTEEGSGGFGAPERILGTRKSISSDIYSAGVLLHYMLTGSVKKIFSMGSEDALFPETREIIKKCTRMNPGERYKDAGVAIKEIHKVLARMETTESGRNISKIIAVPGCPQMGCELAWTAAATLKLKTLVVDLDMLNPAADILLGITGSRFFLQDMDGSKSLEAAVSRVNRNLHLLPCRMDIESFENITVGLVEEKVVRLSACYQLVVILCSDFIYDALSLSAMFLADHIYLPVARGMLDIRKYNALALFLNNRQSVDMDKFHFFQFDYDRGSMRASLASRLVLGGWTGRIRSSRKRKSAGELGGCYARNMEKSMVNAYAGILRRNIMMRRGR